MSVRISRSVEFIECLLFRNGVLDQEFMFLCFSDKDWNEAFNFSKDMSFVNNCLRETNGMSYRSFSFLFFSPSSMVIGYDIMLMEGGRRRNVILALI